MDQVTIGGRIFTLACIHDMIRLTGSDQDPAIKAATGQELSALNLYAQLAQAQALAQIAQHLAPVVIQSDLYETVAADVTDQLDQREDIAKARRPAADSTRCEKLHQMRHTMVDAHKGKMNFPIGEKEGNVLTIFFEQAEGHPWRYLHNGEELTEDQVILLLVNPDKPLGTR